MKIRIPQPTDKGRVNEWDKRKVKAEKVRAR